VSPPPSSNIDSDVGSPSVVQISPANVHDQGQITTTLKVVQKTTNENGSDDNVSPGYSVVRQIVVPPSLAASLQASGRQIMVVTGPGGKKMVALKPIYVSASGNSSNLINKFVTVSSGGGLPARLITTTTSSASSSNASSPDISSTNSTNMAKALAALKSAVPVRLFFLIFSP
jgi:hypothetical protein